MRHLIQKGGICEPLWNLPTPSEQMTNSGGSSDMHSQNPAAITPSRSNKPWCLIAILKAMQLVMSDERLNWSVASVEVKYF